MSIANIQKIWAMIGAVVLALNASWIPEIVKGIFDPTAGELIFSALGAIIALWQFLKSRTGETEEPAAYKTGEKSKIAYMLWPFKKAQ